MPLARTSPAIEVQGVSRVFEAGGRRIEALTDLSFAMQPGELVSMVGPSGSGKTTLVRILAGLLQPTSGEIRVEGRRVAGPPPEVLILFQQYEKSLLPWRSASDNVHFALENQHLRRAERRRRVDDALAAVGLADFRHQYPRQLSGGMQQRLAIARALARRPRVLLMDEPFSSVDAMTRAELQDLILQLWRDRGQTILFVTHDVDEAVYLSSRVLVLSSRPGRIRCEVGVPLPYPRRQTVSRGKPEFLQARLAILETIYAEQGGSDAGRIASHLP